MKKKRINSLLVFTLVTLACFAQTNGYRFKAVIEPVKEPGFYNILLTPALNAHLKTDYSDFRIINGAGKWVPHLLRYPKAELTNESVLWNLEIVKNLGNANSSELIIKTPGQSLSNITFITRNTSVQRFGSLTGSDDSINWYIINDSVLISPAISAPGDSEFSLNFRPNTYHFYKLSIANKGKAPYAIKAAATNAAAMEPGANQSLLLPIQNPAANISHQDSAKTTYIRVVQNAGFHVDEIELKLSGPKYFNRNIQIYIPAAENIKNVFTRKSIAALAISSNSSLRFPVPVFSDSIFYLAISNEDNLPLTVEAVNTYCGMHVATVYMEKNFRYNIIMGNAGATLPRYDLKQDDIDVNKLLPLVSTGNITMLGDKLPGTNAWYNNKWMLWLFIGAAAAVLCMFTFRLIKDIGKTKPPLP